MKALAGLCCLFLVFTAGAGDFVHGADAHDAAPVWTLEFDHQVRFHTMLEPSLLMVATRRHLYGIDPENGQRLWRVRNLSIGPGDLYTLPDSQHVLVNDAFGGPFNDLGTNILALHKRTGRIVWESEFLHGRAQQGVHDADAGVLYVVTVPNPHGDNRSALGNIVTGRGLRGAIKRKPRMYAVRIDDGAVMWSQEFPHRVALQPVTNIRLNEEGDWQRTRGFTLSLFHPPVLTNTGVCVSYRGVHCYAGVNGDLIWKDKEKVLTKKLALSYFAPFEHDGVVYASDNDRIRAYDSATGSRLWKSEKLHPVPEVIVDDKLIYAQLGGYFFDIDDERWTYRGDFGAAAVRRDTGETVWKYADAEDAITNLTILGHQVWLADEKHLIALNRGSGLHEVRAAHGFKNPPIYSGYNRHGQIVLMNQTEIASYDTAVAERAWYTRHKTLKPGLWTRFSGRLMRGAGAVLKLTSFLLSNVKGLFPSLPSMRIPLADAVSVKLYDPNAIITGTTGRSGRRLAFTEIDFDGPDPAASLTGGHRYFVTRFGRFKQALAMVNLDTGQTDRVYPLPSPFPNIVIDEASGLIYEAGERSVSALPL